VVSTGIQVVLARDVAVQDEGGAHGLGQGPDALAECLALVGEGELRPVAMQELR